MPRCLAWRPSMPGGGAPPNLLLVGWESCDEQRPAPSSDAGRGKAAKVSVKLLLRYLPDGTEAVLSTSRRCAIDVAVGVHPQLPTG